MRCSSLMNYHFDRTLSIRMAKWMRRLCLEETARAAWSHSFCAYINLIIHLDLLLADSSLVDQWKT